MQNAEQEGLPLPVWSMQGNADELAAKLGNGFEFRGPGWYGEPDRTIFIGGGSQRSALEMFKMMLGVVEPPKEGEPETLTCYVWSFDPRARITALIRLGNQTQMPVPAVVRDTWPAIAEAAASLKEWADAGIADVAAKHGAVTITVPAIGELPQSFTKSQDVSHEGKEMYRIGPYVIGVPNQEQLARLTAREPLPHMRLILNGETSLLIVLHPDG